MRFFVVAFLLMVIYILLFGPVKTPYNGPERGETRSAASASYIKPEVVCPANPVQWESWDKAERLDWLMHNCKVK